LVHNPGWEGKVSGGFRLGDLAERVGGRVVGDADAMIRGVATLEEAGPDQLSFLSNTRYREAARRTNAGAILIEPGSGIEGPALVEVDEPYLALAKILRLFEAGASEAREVSPEAHVGRNVRLGKDVSIAPFAVIGDGVELGDRVTIGAGSVVGSDSRVGTGSILMPRVVIYPGTEIGRDCLLHAGVVLGSDGFGFATSGGRHHKLPQLGRVVLEDDVELGANTTVDRGTLGETVIGANSKLDNLVMIAHGVTLGESCLMAAQSGIAGSTQVGSNVTFAGQSGAAGHLKIADGTVVAAKTAVFADVDPGAFVAGTPAVDHRTWKRSQVLIKRLPDLRKELTELRRRVEALEALDATEARSTEED
jgi:UDP-3-O-[3-hydroxymyristoyl] glucosamine N-acyltransferase